MTFKKPDMDKTLKNGLSLSEMDHTNQKSKLMEDPLPYEVNEESNGGPVEWPSMACTLDVM